MPLLHLSNRYLDLEPAAAAIARSPEALRGLDAASGWIALPAPTARAWTDDYANVPSAFRR